MDISIIIPTYNRKEKLRRCIDSIYSQKFPNNKYEIIVVDDGSTDNTFLMVNKIKKLHSNLKYIRLGRKNGPAKARNHGIKVAKGNIIGFTDNDCILGRRWLRKMSNHHKTYPEITAVGGYTYVGRPDLKTHISQFMANGAIKAQISHREDVIFFPTCNVSLKKRVFKKEKFNEIFQYPGGEDLEFFWRLYKKGYKFIYNDKIKVHHIPSTSFFQFIYQPYRYGKANFLVKKIHPDHPALEDLNSDNIVKFLYCLLKELIRSPFLSVLLAYRLNSIRKKSQLLDYLLSIFYFFIFRIMYLIGNFTQGISYLSSNWKKVIKNI